MSGQHTPGPWEVRVSGVFLRVVHGEHKVTVADGIVSETNARLIAAAPEMLSALEQYATGYTDTGACARAAIAKARGAA